MLIRQILEDKPIGKKIEVKGWVRTKRDGKGISFIEVNDGSCLKNLQIVASSEHLLEFENIVSDISTGSPT